MISEGLEPRGPEYLKLFEIVHIVAFTGSCIVEYIVDKFLRKKESCGALSCILLCADHFHENNLIIDVTPEYVPLF